MPTVTEWFLAGVGLGALLFVVGYVQLWAAVLVSFGCGVVADWIRRR